MNPPTSVRGETPNFKNNGYVKDLAICTTSLNVKVLLFAVESRLMKYVCFAFSVKFVFQENNKKKLDIFGHGFVLSGTCRYVLQHICVRMMRILESRFILKTSYKPCRFSCVKTMTFYAITCSLSRFMLRGDYVYNSCLCSESVSDWIRMILQLFAKLSKNDDNDPNKYFNRILFTLINCEFHFRLLQFFTNIFQSKYV